MNCLVPSIFIILFLGVEPAFEFSWFKKSGIIHYLLQSFNYGALALIAILTPPAKLYNTLRFKSLITFFMGIIIYLLSTFII